MKSSHKSLINLQKIENDEDYEYDTQKFKAERDKSGCRRLFDAADRDDFNFVRYLIEECNYGINWRNKSGETILDVIMEKYNPRDKALPKGLLDARTEILRFLLLHPRTNEETVTQALNTAIKNTHVPVRRKEDAPHLAITDIFDTNKVNQKLTDKRSRTALHYVAEHRSQPKHIYSGLALVDLLKLDQQADHQSDVSGLALVDLLKQDQPMLAFDVLDNERKKPEDLAHSPYFKIYLQAERYIQQRRQEDLYKTKFSIFGFFTMRFGYSKYEKLAAADKLAITLKKYIREPTKENLNLDELVSHHPALDNGDLGNIFQEVRGLSEKTRPGLSVA